MSETSHSYTHTHNCTYPPEATCLISCPNILLHRTIRQIKGLHNLHNMDSHVTLEPLSLQWGTSCWEEDENRCLFFTECKKLGFKHRLSCWYSKQLWKVNISAQCFYSDGVTERMIVSTLDWWHYHRESRFFANWDKS